MDEGEGDRSTGDRDVEEDTGKEHPNKLTTMNNLAFTMKEQGRKLEAIKLIAECVQLRSRVLGTENPQTG